MSARVTRRNATVAALPYLIPTLLPVIAFSVVPLVAGVALGFTDARLGVNSVISFNGIDNYVDLAGDTLFIRSLGVGLVWAFAVTGLQFVLSLGLALILNSRPRFGGAVRVIALIPWAIPPVIIAMLWILVLDPRYGALNAVLGGLGLPDGTNWLGSVGTALPSVIVVGVWAGMPMTTITLLAGLQGVPTELHEAAQLDGAGGWQRFRAVTLPALMPVVLAITTLDFIWNFNSFALVYVLTAGGPGGLTMLPLLFAYNEAFRYGEFGTASAMGNVMVVLLAVLLVVYLRFQQKGARR